MSKNNTSMNFNDIIADQGSTRLQILLEGKKVYLRTYGCQLNENDTEKIHGVFDFYGCVSVSNMDQADIIVFNTCTIRENANDKIWGHLGMVQNIKEQNPGLLVILCGCMMKEDHQRERIRDRHKYVDVVIGPSDIHRLPYMLLEHFQTGKSVIGVGDEDMISENIPLIRGKNFRALCTVIYGCNNFCSYCIVPYVRGRERSRSIEDILDEVRRIAESGFKEVLLLGQNVNSYGSDGNEHDFADLLNRISMVPGIRRIRFMTSHPKDLSKKIIDVMASAPNIMPHIHLPLQSGSDRILKLMNRGYTRSQYTHIVEYAREKIPNLAITTDLIVGFPGETEEDFIDTLTAMGHIKFDSAFTFQYSERKGTAAASFENKVEPEIVKSRFEKLVALQNACSFASNQALVDSVQEVLVEGFSDKDAAMLTGRTPQHRLVHFAAPDKINIGGKPAAQQSPEGEFAVVKITRAKTFSLEGEWMEWL